MQTENERDAVCDAFAEFIRNPTEQMLTDFAQKYNVGIARRSNIGEAGDRLIQTLSMLERKLL